MSSPKLNLPSGLLQIRLSGRIRMLSIAEI